MMVSGGTMGGVGMMRRRDPVNSSREFFCDELTVTVCFGHHVTGVGKYYVGAIGLVVHKCCVKHPVASSSSSWYIETPHRRHTCIV